ncbi:MAG: hypothetical protein ACRENP_05425 [Longimicrobiales bacterium]
MPTGPVVLAPGLRVARGCLFGSLLSISLLGCDQATRQASTSTPLAFEAYFTTIAELKLEEKPGDPIGDIGTLLEARNGDLILTDPIRHHIRRYTRTGELIAVQGRYGSGPFEYRQVAGVLEDQRGAVIVVDPRLQRVTRLRPDLEKDSLFGIKPPPRGVLASSGQGFALLTASGPRTTSLSLLDERWTPLWTMPAPSPGPVARYPYWNSYGAVLLTASAPYVVTAYSLQYPIYLLSVRSGVRVDSLAAAPAGFRRASVLKAGAFAGADAAEREDEWLASFDVIAHLCVLENTFLFVTHGELRRTSTSIAKDEHRRSDVYDLRNLRRIAENIPLRDGARVLGGGEHLYVLTDQPPSSWTIIKVKLRT